MLEVGLDTYIDLAGATAYLADYGDEGAVVTEADLKKATLAIDRLYGGRFTGASTSALQPLQFPRNGDTDIPLAAAHATAELAAMLNAGLNPYIQPDAVVTEESVQVDVLKKARKFAAGYAVNPLHKVSVILAPLMVSTSGGFAFADVVLA